jgi:predicted Fe-S protein YdhL (DUF1289 family)
MFAGNSSNIISPCVGQCQLDEEDVCKGCYRTVAEISHWSKKSEDEKISIVIRCKKKIAERKVEV